jgi:hypothetical protein
MPGIKEMKANQGIEQLRLNYCVFYMQEISQSLVVGQILITKTQAFDFDVASN